MKTRGAPAAAAKAQGPWRVICEEQNVRKVLWGCLPESLGAQDNHTGDKSGGHPGGHSTPQARMEGVGRGGGGSGVEVLVEQP